MLPVSTKQPLRVVPSGFREDDPTAPVYLVRPPSAFLKPRMLAAVDAHGARPVGEDELRARFRKGVEALLVEEQVPVVFALLDESDALREELAALQKVIEHDAQLHAAKAKATGDDAGAQYEPKPKQKARVNEIGTRLGEIAETLADVEDHVRLNLPSYANLLTMRDLWFRIAPLEGFRFAVVGWENVDVGFKLAADRTVDRAAIDQLPEAHVREVGWQAWAVTRLGAETAGN